MQHHYVADVGDYIKLALLRQLEPGHRIGVVWWLFPSETQKGDGRHIAYLQKNDWRGYDPELFDQLGRIVASGRREIDALQGTDILRDATFFGDTVPVAKDERAKWLNDGVRRVESCDIVFLDPDNGLEPRTFVAGRKFAGKSVAYEELSAFAASGMTLVVYHHQTRAKGGHLVEIQNLAERLGQRFDRVDAIRTSPFSPRVFFLLNASPEILRRIDELCERWKGKLELNPHRSDR